jgi:hypothetical protein
MKRPVPQHTLSCGLKTPKNIKEPHVSKTIKFVLEKEVKNSVRFKEVTEAGEAEVLGSIYVQKWYAKNCTELTVTLTTPLDPA